MGPNLSRTVFILTAVMLLSPAAFAIDCPHCPPGEQDPSEQGFGTEL